MLSLDNYLQRFVASAHTNRYLFPILEEFLVNDVYLNKKKQIQKRMDSLVSPLKNASKVMADAPGNIFGKKMDLLVDLNVFSFAEDIGRASQTENDSIRDDFLRFIELQRR